MVTVMLGWYGGSWQYKGVGGAGMRRCRGEGELGVWVWAGCKLAGGDGDV